MKYEYIIRKAHQCGRGGVPGANADIIALLGSGDFSSNENKQRGIDVNYYLTTAINKVIREKKQILTEQQLITLENCCVVLRELTLDNIVKVINDVDIIFSEIKF